jgi:hypothetical protein
VGDAENKKRVALEKVKHGLARQRRLPDAGEGEEPAGQGFSQRCPLKKRSVKNQGSLESFKYRPLRSELHVDAGRDRSLQGCVRAIR